MFLVWFKLKWPYTGYILLSHTAEADSKLTSTLTEHLFQRPGERFGSDLAARNIQRGRDHKIATYGMVR